MIRDAETARLESMDLEELLRRFPIGTFFVGAFCLHLLSYFGL